MLISVCLAPGVAAGDVIMTSLLDTGDML